MKWDNLGLALESLNWWGIGNKKVYDENIIQIKLQQHHLSGIYLRMMARMRFW